MTRRRSRATPASRTGDDVSTIKSYAVDPVVRMVDSTIVNGISDGLGGAQLAPSGTATREQAVIMANRFCSEFEKLSPNKSGGRYHQAEHDGQHAEQPLEHPEHDHSGR